MDTSDAGAQPMLSGDGRWVIVLNGEVYGHHSIKEHLQNAGVRFRGHSDTEVLLEAIAYWGLRIALDRVRGMFAFGLWDRIDSRLYLVRDRMGEKPLYFRSEEGAISFGSELKSILALAGSSRPRVDQDSVTSFLRYGFIPGDRTIFEGVYKVPPGSVCEFDAATGRVIKWNYWVLPTPCSSSSCLNLTPEKATEELEGRLSNAVRDQSIADVPLGALLSGGIDSSTIVALMSAGGRQVRTFTVGFHESGFNEAIHARSVAKHLGAEHTELYVTPDEAMDVITDLPYSYDEPFADSSQIPTYLISKLAASKVTVALSGDGGDELFGGYGRYERLQAVMDIVNRTPGRVSRMGLRAMGIIPDGAWDRILPAIWRLRGGDRSMAPTSDTLRKLGDVFDAGGDPAVAYDHLMSQWTNVENLVIGADTSRRAFVDAWPGGDSLVGNAAHADALVYLPDDILVKVDRASMAHSLEVRAPLLDHELVEWAWSLPPSLRFGGPKPKWLLRQVLYRHVPPELVDRPKMGFGVPVGDWVRGPMRPWAEALLAEDKLRDAGILNADLVIRVWREHLSGRRDHSSRVWTLLMFQAWWERWMA